MPRARPLLERRDWVRAGQELLREGGVPAVKLTALAGGLGVTTGSFYHHFRDREDFLGALAERYGTEDLVRIETAAAAVADPVERVHLLRRLSEQPRVRVLDRAMRVWATPDGRARDAVGRLDSGFLAIIGPALREIGFDEDEVRIRAHLVLSAGAGNPLVQADAQEHPEDARRALDVVIRPPGDAGSGPRT